MSTSLEEGVLKQSQLGALEEVKAEFGKYFESVRQHPRLLIGQSVPSMHGDGQEVLRTSADAADWQAAVKSVLTDEINARAEIRTESARQHLQILHGSIELFQNNSDLVPGTTTFDKELADRVARFGKPYEIRNDGKLVGYSIPLQKLVQQERAALAASRAAAPAPAPVAAPATGAPAASGAAPVAQPAPVVEGPQAGIQSRAGQASEGENFDTLFGTIGLSGLRF